MSEIYGKQPTDDSKLAYLYSVVKNYSPNDTLRLVAKTGGVKGFNDLKTGAQEKLLAALQNTAGEKVKNQQAAVNESVQRWSEADTLKQQSLMQDWSKKLGQT